MIKYLVEVCEPYEEPQFEMVTSNRLHALEKTLEKFDKLDDIESVRITEWENDLLNTNATIEFPKINGEAELRNAIKQAYEEEQKLLFIVTSGSIYEDTNFGTRVLMSNDKEKAFNLVNTLLSNDSNDEYREKIISMSVVRDSERLDKGRFDYKDAAEFKAFAEKYGVDIEPEFKLETKRPKP